MKMKSFEMPEINISYFITELLLTTSGDVEATSVKGINYVGRNVVTEQTKYSALFGGN